MHMWYWLMNMCYEIDQQWMHVGAIYAPNAHKNTYISHKNIVGGMSSTVNQLSNIVQLSPPNITYSPLIIVTQRYGDQSAHKWECEYLSFVYSVHTTLYSCNLNVRGMSYRANRLSNIQLSPPNITYSPLIIATQRYGDQSEHNWQCEYLSFVHGVHTTLYSWAYCGRNEL